MSTRVNCCILLQLVHWKKWHQNKSLLNPLHHSKVYPQFYGTSLLNERQASIWSSTIPLFLRISVTSIHLWVCGLYDVVLACAVMWKLDYRVTIVVPLQALLLDSGHVIGLQLWIYLFGAAIEFLNGKNVLFFLMCCSSSKIISMDWSRKLFFYLDWKS